MKLEVIAENSWERADPRNAGVLADEMVATSQGVCVRRVRYRCPPFDRLRADWLGETKAWASSANAKTMQAHFLCMAHNLMICCEGQLEREHGVRNEAELARRAKRLEKEEKRLAKEKLVMPMPIRQAQDRVALRQAQDRVAPAAHGALGEVHPLAEGATLRPASPRARYRHPAPVIRSFISGILDTLAVFCFAQVITDAEVLIHMAKADGPLHRSLHTYSGATGVALVAWLLGGPVCRRALRAWDSTPGLPLKEYFDFSPDIPPVAAITGAFIGTYSHVFLDSLIYADMSPLFPISGTNAAFGLISPGALHGLCFLASLPGIWLCARAHRKRVRRLRAPGSDAA